jgi:glycosyltransferase involved in cell wall biosynthesis
LNNIAIIIPAYNEEKTIIKVVEKCIKHGEIIIVNDCSTDSTRVLCEKMNHKVINNVVNLGYEKTIYKGIQYALSNKYKFALTVDGDNQNQEVDIKTVIELILKGFDLVIGKRPSFQRESEKLISKITNKFYGLEDPLSGLKAYRLEKLINFNFEAKDTIGTSAALHIIENKGTFRETEISIQPRLGSQSILGKDDLITNYSFLKNFINNNF